MKGRIFDIKGFAIHDGPGVRTTVFLKGCPLDCWWCHNPESKDPGTELVYNPTKCAGIGACIEACPENAIEMEGEGVVIDRDICTSCGECATACPSTALRAVGRTATVDEVMDEIRKSIIYFDASDGGLTVSGGEPLAQPDFLEALLERARAEGIRTTLDTTGFAPQSVMQTVSPAVDTFLYDLKFLDDDRHREYTGVSNESILENLEWLVEQGRGEDIVLRRPVITGINDSADATEALAEYLEGLGDVARIDLLPFHDVSEKYERFGKDYRITDRRPPSGETLQMIEDTLVDAGLTVKVSGY